MIDDFFNAHFGENTWHTEEHRMLDGTLQYVDYHLDEYDNVSARTLMELHMLIGMNFKIMTDYDDNLKIRIYLK